MQPIESIIARLEVIDGRDYGAYQSLIGCYRYPQFTLHIEQIPKDPYAPPHTGIYRAQVSLDLMEVPDQVHEIRLRNTAFCDFKCDEQDRDKHQCHGPK